MNTELLLYDYLINNLTTNFKIENIPNFKAGLFSNANLLSSKKKCFNMKFNILFSMDVDDIDSALDEICGFGSRPTSFIWVNYFNKASDMSFKIMKKDLTFFNDEHKSFVHILLIYDVQSVQYDSDFYYYGARYIKQALKSIDNSIKSYHQMGDTVL